MVRGTRWDPVGPGGTRWVGWPKAKVGLILFLIATALMAFDAKNLQPFIPEEPELFLILWKHQHADFSQTTKRT